MGIRQAFINLEAGTKTEEAGEVKQKESSKQTKLEGTRRTQEGRQGQQEQPWE